MMTVRSELANKLIRRASIFIAPFAAQAVNLARA